MTVEQYLQRGTGSESLLKDPRPLTRVERDRLYMLIYDADKLGIELPEVGWEFGLDLMEVLGIKMVSYHGRQLLANSHRLYSLFWAEG
jgi:hypothetical protein